VLPSGKSTSRFGGWVRGPLRRVLHGIGNDGGAQMMQQMMQIVVDHELEGGAAGAAGITPPALSWVDSYSRRQP
jgi:hypothetical protein